MTGASSERHDTVFFVAHVRATLVSPHEARFSAQRAELHARFLPAAEFLFHAQVGSASFVGIQEDDGIAGQMCDVHENVVVALRWCVRFELIDALEPSRLVTHGYDRMVPLDRISHGGVVLGHAHPVVMVVDPCVLVMSQNGPSFGCRHDRPGDEIELVVHLDYDGRLVASLADALALTQLRCATPTTA